MRSAILVLVLCAAPLAAQPSVPDPLLNWMDSIAQRPLDEREMWTDPVDWMGGSMALGPGSCYRQSGEPDAKLVEEFLR